MYHGCSEDMSRTDKKKKVLQNKKSNLNKVFSNKKNRCYSFGFIVGEY